MNLVTAIEWCAADCGKRNPAAQSEGHAAYVSTNKRVLLIDDVPARQPTTPSW